MMATTVVLLACDRTGESEPEQEAPQTPSTSQLPGFALGQVATVQEPPAEVPIDSIDPVELGRNFRAAVRDLSMFGEEGTPGPVIDFVLYWSAGLVSDDRALIDLDAPHEGTFAVLVLRVEGEARGDEIVEFELNGLYREPHVDHENLDEMTARLVLDGIRDIVTGLEAEAAPRVSTDLGLLELLDSDEVGELLPAIREVYRRRLTTAAPRLRALLNTEDPELIFSAATALGRIGDADAVGPLIDLISRDHREMTSYVLPILGDIGTQEARIYLETVADAHDDPLVRSQAREVLDSMMDYR